MTWARFEGDARSHPKVAALSDTARVLWRESIEWSVEFRTRGVIRANVPLSAITTSHSTRQQLAHAAQELVSVGLWHDLNGGGFAIHDFDVYQPDLDDARVKAAQRKRLQRERQRHA